MSASVTLEIIKGSNAGASYTYTEKESLILGRAEDCSIVLDENTVSRYHCMVEIAPPAANFHDFGSGNGIKLNGKTVVEGRFKTGQSRDEALDDVATEFSLKDGDTIALSSTCELAVKVFIPEYCAECLEELEEGSESLYQNEIGENVCSSCFEAGEKRKAAEEERLRIEQEEIKKAEEAALLEKQAAEAELAKKLQEIKEQKLADAQAKEAEIKKQQAEIKRQQDEAIQKQKQAEADEKARLAKLRRDAINKARDAKNSCMICGSKLPENRAANDARICQSCRANPMVVLEYMLKMAAQGEPGIAEIKGFKKIKELGRGGQGAVYKVEEEATGKLFALKMMLSNVSSQEDARAKFLREASIGKQLDHPNILRHYRYGSSGDAYFILQEICDGGSVDALIAREGGKLSPDLAVNITLQILDALIYAHAKQIEVDLANGSVDKFNGIVHRDIKPGNYFVLEKTGPLVVKLADFGMAKAFEAAGLTGFTRTGDAGGTPVFMPRQQIMNYKYVQPDVDVWAVAASLYFMLTGRFPKDFSDKKDPWTQALKNPAVPILKRNRHIDKRLASVIDHALVEKPSIGFSTAAELKEAIEGAI